MATEISDCRMYAEERRVIVKAIDSSITTLGDSKAVAVSHLSAMDTLMPPIRFQLYFFYGYVVSEMELEKALEATLGRYSEFSGRIDLPNAVVNLTNEGALISYLQKASINFEALKETNFNYQLCAAHFNDDNGPPDEFLFKMTVQKLANDSGMVLSFGFNHCLADINSAYLFIADYCSQVKSKEFKFEAAKVSQGERLKHVSPSGQPPAFEHPEIMIVETHEKLAEMGAKMMKDLIENPTAAINFDVTPEKVKQLKQDVYNRANLEQKETMSAEKIYPSTNDCLISLIYEAFAETAIDDAQNNPENILPFQLSINSRFRRSPPVSRETLGNFILLAVLDITKDDLAKMSSFDLAFSMRKRVLEYDEKYVQSSIDKIAINELSQFTSFWHAFTLRFTNWNRYFDWYPDSDLGQGPPEKFGTCSRMFVNYCVVKPGRVDGYLDLTIALHKPHMEKFLEHKNVKEYLQVS